MKSFILALALLGALGSSAKASQTMDPLDLFAFPGWAWGRVDGRLNSNSNTTGQTRNGRVMATVQQGVQLRNFPYVIAYGSFNVYQPLEQPTDKYLAFGAENNTLIPHVTFGIEHQNSSLFTREITVSNRWVAFASAYLEWGKIK